MEPDEQAPKDPRGFRRAAFAAGNFGDRRHGASPVWSRAFADLDIQREDQLDLMFYRDKMPPAFVDALGSTRCAFAEWKRIAAEDRVKLLVATTEGVRGNGEGQLAKLSAILEPLGIPLLDLYPAFRARGELAAAHWNRYALGADGPSMGGGGDFGLPFPKEDD